MSQLQRVIVRYGLEEDTPALKMAELGWDTDTWTMRVGDDTPYPAKIMTTKSTGIFDFRSATKVYLPDTSFGSIEGIDLSTLSDGEGFIVSTGDPENFKIVTFTSSDSSVIIENADGQDGYTVDIRVSTSSISDALIVIQQQLNDQRDDIDNLQLGLADTDDTVLRLVQLTGVAAKQTDLGTFTGDIIPDNVKIKVALQSLESFSEDLHDLIISQSPALEIRGQDSISIELALNNSNPNITLPQATSTLAGLMSAVDKAKSDLINISTGTADLNGFDDWKASVDSTLNSHTTKIFNIENQLNTIVLSGAVFFEEVGEPVWISDENNTYTDINAKQYTAFMLTYDRVGDGNAQFKYEEITINDVVVVFNEYPIVSYTDRVVVFKKGSAWYYLKDSVGIEIPVDGTTNLIRVQCGNNAVVIKQMNIV